MLACCVEQGCLSRDASLLCGAGMFEQVLLACCVEQGGLSSLLCGAGGFEQVLLACCVV